MDQDMMDALVIVRAHVELSLLVGSGHRVKSDMDNWRLQSS
jgi:hypothetical protein